MAAKKSLNKYAETIVNCDKVIELLLAGKDVNTMVISDTEETELYNEHCEQVTHNPLPLRIATTGVSMAEYHSANVNKWNMPDEYAHVDVHAYLLDKCSTPAETTRVNFEYALYQEYDLDNVLRFLIYLVDTMTSHNILWGVGRGSSVASYCLYLIGIHKVDSLKYNLCVKEFLK